MQKSLREGGSEKRKNGGKRDLLETVSITSERVIWLHGEKPERTTTV